MPRWNGFVIFVIKRFQHSLLSFFFLLFAVVAGAEPGRSALDIMTFEDQFVCQDRFPHHSFCEAVAFKAWSNEEKQLVSEFLKNINDPRLEYFFEVIRTKGITKLHRVSYSASWHNNITQRRAEFSRNNDKALLWVNPVTKVIGFTDAFFRGTAFVDPYAQVERKQLNVFHELVHVFDIALDHASTSREFYESTGWGWDGKGHVIHGVDYAQVKADFKTILGLVAAKKSAEAYALDRELGRRYGFPTVYGMMNTHESFAELVSYYIFDPTAKDYLSPQIVQYINSVLKEK